MSVTAEQPLLSARIATGETEAQLPQLSWAERAIQHAIHHPTGKLLELAFDDEGLRWNSQELDFHIWQQIDALLSETATLSDNEFQVFIPKIEMILRQSPLMQLLNSSEITVSRAQKGTTPFQHTINVLRQLKTNGLKLEQRKALRWMALFHDVGKIFGADGEESYFHPFLSAFISSEFLFREVKDLSAVTIQQMLYVLQFHHLYEEMHYQRIDHSEASLRMKEMQVALFFHLLCTADVSSVPAHVVHAIANHQTLATIQHGVYRYLKRVEIVTTELATNQ